MLRHFYFAAFMQPFWLGVQQGSDETLSGIAGKAYKEVGYHVRHAGEWIIRMGDGTQVSAAKMADAVDALHPYTAELFIVDEERSLCIQHGILPNIDTIQVQWDASIKNVLSTAKLTIPEVAFPQLGGRTGQHTEDFGHLLACLLYTSPSPRD